MTGRHVATSSKLTTFDAANKIGKNPIHSGGIGSLAAQSDCFLEELVIKHKTRTFHVYSLHPDGGEGR